MSSSESELGEEDRVFAEEMGLPTGDTDLLDSDHSSDEEEGKTLKSKKAVAAAAAAEAAKAAENSWMMGGGGGAGRWGGDGGGGGGVGGDGNQVSAADGGKNEGKTDIKEDNKEAIGSSGMLANEGNGGDVDVEGQGRERTGNAVEVEGRAESATDPPLPSVADLKDAAAEVAQPKQEAGETRSYMAEL